MFFSSRAKKEIHTLLITRFSALGDVAMTVPAIYSAAKQYPDVRFLLATRPFFGRILIDAPKNVRVVPFELTHYKGVIGLFRLIRELHGLRPDAVADFHNVFRTWLIDFSFILVNIPVSMLDKQRSKRKNLSKGGQCRPFTHRYFDVLQRLGINAHPQFSSVFETRTSPIILPPTVPVKGRNKWIGLAPFAKYLNKTYPYTQGRELILALSSLPATQLFIFGGGKADYLSISSWTVGMSGPMNLVGKYAIEEELAIMSQLDVMITMDSANMHLASLVGVRVVSLWGSTTPSCGFLGWNQREEDALYMGISCQPCTTAGSNLCKIGNYKCLGMLSPALIANKVRGIIDE